MRHFDFAYFIFPSVSTFYSVQSQFKPELNPAAACINTKRFPNCRPRVLLALKGLYSLKISGCLFHCACAVTKRQVGLRFDQKLIRDLFYLKYD